MIVRCTTDACSIEVRDEVLVFEARRIFPQACVLRNGCAAAYRRRHRFRRVRGDGFRRGSFAARSAAGVQLERALYRVQFRLRLARQQHFRHVGGQSVRLSRNPWLARPPGDHPPPMGGGGVGARRHRLRRHAIERLFFRAARSVTIGNSPTGSSRVLRPTSRAQAFAAAAASPI
jgi:hypothetical protein